MRNLLSAIVAFVLSLGLVGQTVNPAGYVPGNFPPVGHVAIGPGGEGNEPWYRTTTPGAPLQVTGQPMWASGVLTTASWPSWGNQVAFATSDTGYYCTYYAWFLLWYDSWAGQSPTAWMPVTITDPAFEVAYSSMLAPVGYTLLGATHTDQEFCLCSHTVWLSFPLPATQPSAETWAVNAQSLILTGYGKFRLGNATRIYISNT